jgi:low temperature requirement protein LtrA
MKLRKDLIKTPRLSSSYKYDDDRHANWTELLFDLIFVAAISQLSLNLGQDYNFMGLLESLPLFFVVWWGWVGHTFYLSRFGIDDFLNRVLTMLQMLAVTILAINVKDALGATGSGFAISYAVLRFILVAEYYRVGRNIPETKPLTNHYVLGFLIAAVLWLISAFIPSPWRFIIWGIALLIDLITPISASEKHVKFPPHSSHLPERFGLFTIIVIGEAIVSVVFGISGMSVTLDREIIGLMGLLIAFSIWWGYFEEARGAEARVLQAGNKVGKYQLWLYSHFPLMIGIVAVAAGIKHVIFLGFWKPLPLIEVWMLCTALGIVLISLTAIFLSSFDLERCKERDVQISRLPYYVIIVLVFLTGLLGQQVPGSVILAILTILCLSQVVLSLFERPSLACRL